MKVQIRLYNQAVTILHSVLTQEKSKSLKSQVFECKDQSINKKQLMAFLCRVLEYKSVVDQLIDRAQLYQSLSKAIVRKTNNLKFLLIVMAYEIAIEQLSKVQSVIVMKDKGPPAQLFNHLWMNKTRLRSELSKLKIQKGVKDNSQLVDQNIAKMAALSDKIPRYARVNAFVMGISDVCKALQQQGYQQVDSLTSMFEEIKSTGTQQSQTNKKSVKIFATDEHIPNLLVFPPGHDLHLNKLYQDGALILQDKASCMPVAALLDGYDTQYKGAVCIDACAAPGNKTSQLSAAVYEDHLNAGCVYAFDIDRVRLNTLEMQMRKYGCLNVSAQCQSFLDIDPHSEPYNQVRFIVLDPSCSGSGIVNRLDYLVDSHRTLQRSGNRIASSINGTQVDDTNDQQAEDRLENLSAFQKKMLLHALSFPAVERVSYSTCSVNIEENEAVVEDCLQKCKDKWQLYHALPQWTNRGVNGMDQVIRVDPHKHLTNGFFVAIFERRIKQGQNGDDS
ncbi:hypothetical protein MP228_004357 [Amoeboaphelidium protococcarum]|nr:hypothetical protein MP228_004357 [Amoeboaphelidium protococcarum]